MYNRSNSFRKSLKTSTSNVSNIRTRNRSAKSKLTLTRKDISDIISSRQFTFTELQKLVKRPIVPLTGHTTQPLKKTHTRQSSKKQILKFSQAMKMPAVSSLEEKLNDLFLKLITQHTLVINLSLMIMTFELMAKTTQKADNSEQVQADISEYLPDFINKLRNLPNKGLLDKAQQFVTEYEKSQQIIQQQCEEYVKATYECPKNSQVAEVLRENLETELKKFSLESILNRYVDLLKSRINVLKKEINSLETKIKSTKISSKKQSLKEVMSTKQMQIQQFKNLLEIIQNITQTDEIPRALLKKINRDACEIFAASASPIFFRLKPTTHIDRIICIEEQNKQLKQTLSALFDLEKTKKTTEKKYKHRCINIFTKILTSKEQIEHLTSGQLLQILQRCFSLKYQSDTSQYDNNFVSMIDSALKQVRDALVTPNFTIDDYKELDSESSQTNTTQHPRTVQCPAAGSKANVFFNLLTVHTIFQVHYLTVKK